MGTWGLLSQGAQYGLIKEYLLNYMGILNMIYSILIN